MSPAPHDNADFARQREQMVEKQLARRGISDPRVLDAMRAVPRHEFVDPSLLASAYEDGSLPIGQGQTVSQPYVVAFMAESARVRASDRVLEVGAGCGYAAAVLGRLGRTVDAVERIPELAAEAGQRLERLGVLNVHVHLADDQLGLPDEAPFDVIVVSAAAESLPHELLDQLAEGGRLVIPIGPREEGQTMYRLTRRGDQFEQDYLGRFAFVPLVTEGQAS